MGKPNRRLPWIVSMMLLLLGSGGLALGQEPGASPVFSNPTNITNPYFPISSIAYAVMNGEEGGTAYQTEETLLPYTRTIEWGGGRIEAVIVQYIAYADGQLAEVAYDYYAQADDGSVYYLGEDVTNYAGGRVLNHEGSWLAGWDGAPPAVIMPAHPEVGMVFYPENRPGLVFETVDIVSQSEETITPAGPIVDGMLLQETLMDGTVEYKVWARGYGVVEVRAEDEHLSLIEVVYTTDARSTIPPDLGRLTELEQRVLQASGTDNLAGAADALAQASAIWVRLRPQVLAAGGAAAAWQFEQSMNTQIAAAALEDTATLAQEAAHGPDLIVGLSQLF